MSDGWSRKGGEEAKVIESQNSQLMQQIDELTYALDLAKAAKTNVAEEAEQLRAELQRNQDEIKIYMEELNKIREQVRNQMIFIIFINVIFIVYTVCF